MERLKEIRNLVRRKFGLCPVRYPNGVVIVTLPYDYWPEQGLYMKQTYRFVRGIPKDAKAFVAALKAEQGLLDKGLANPRYDEMKIECRDWLILTEV